MNNSPAFNYSLGAFLIIVTVLSFVFLDGSTAVFLGIAAAVGGALFLIMGVQGSNGPSAADELGAGGNERDWDELYLRDFGPEEHK